MPGPAPRILRRPRIRRATFNLSVAAAKHKPEQLLKDLVKVMGRNDVVCIQEAGAARELVEQAARIAGGTVWFGDGETGQASTPIYVSPLCQRFRFEAHRLIRQGRYIGPGAGPDRSKAKWLMVALIVLDQQRHAVGNVHLTASQQNPLRMVAALLEVRRANKAMRTYRGRHHCSLLGDLNNTFVARTFWRLRVWLHSTQKRLGAIGTHGKRAIDDCYEDATLHPIEHTARATVSDHRVYEVVSEVVAPRAA